MIEEEKVKDNCEERSQDERVVIKVGGGRKLSEGNNKCVVA